MERINNSSCTTILHIARSRNNSIDTITTGNADRLGIVYTPREIVKFQIETVDLLLEKHFSKSLADEGVKILDPCTGTGTYLCDLIDYLPPHRLAHKYAHDIYANELGLLPYYIANLNIEYTYQQKMNEYVEFNHICWMDTLETPARISPVQITICLV